MLCFSFNIGVGQIINIPDANFKALLVNSSTSLPTASDCAIDSYYKIDINNNGEIEYSEALPVCSLVLVNANISDLTGIEAFTNLKGLSCTNNNLTNVNLSQLTQLDGVNFYQNQLTSLDISNLPNFKVLECTYNQITSLNFGNNPLLERVFCSNNQLTSLDFSNNPLFNQLDCMNNPNLTSINISNGTNQLLGPQTYYNQCWTGCPNLTRICADSSELFALENYLDSCNIDINTITFTSNCNLGNEAFTKNVMVVYPNPFKNSFKISVPNLISNNVTIKVYDMLGKIIEVLDLSTQDLSTLELGKNYKSGVYTILVQQSKNLQTLRVIKE